MQYLIQMWLSSSARPTTQEGGRAQSLRPRLEQLKAQGRDAGMSAASGSR